jgi:hypothetical protein
MRAVAGQHLLKHRLHLRGPARLRHRPEEDIDPADLAMTRGFTFVGEKVV